VDPASVEFAAARDPLGRRLVRRMLVSVPGAASGCGAAADASPDGQQLELSSDVYVVCTGNHSNLFSAALGDGWHSWPVRGLALEVPLQPGARPLAHNVVDDVRRNYIAPLGRDRVRLSGYVEIGGAVPPAPGVCGAGGCSVTDHASFNQDAVTRQIMSQARSLLPPNYLVELGSGGSDSSGVRGHACYRPQTADDLPVVAVSRSVGNLYYNTGHGHLGLTRAAGAAKLLSGLVLDRKYNPAVDTDGDIAPPDAGHFDHARFEFSLRNSYQFLRKCIHIFK
jgi:D-amino-acid dehydrogenase